MKSTFFKILSLAAGALLVSLGIGIYLDTVATPPRQLEFPDPYKADVQADISRMSSTSDTQEREQLFYTIQHKIGFEHQQEKFDTDARDALIEDFAGAYTPIFLGECRNRFRSSVWNDDDHPAMLSRVNEIKAITINDGAVEAIGASQSNALDSVTHTIALYRKARAVASRSSFVSIAQARTTIDEAATYASTDPLCNCTALVSALGQVAANIHTSHYNQLVAKVASLERRRDECIRSNYYNNFDYGFYDNFHSRVYQPTIAAIEDYENRTGFYPSHNSVSSLLSRCNAADRAVKSHYQDVSNY